MLPMREGVSQETGKEWKSKDVVLEADDNVVYPDIIVASLKGDNVDKFRFREGDKANMLLSFFARENGGRWYNNIIIRDWEQSCN